MPLGLLWKERPVASGCGDCGGVRDRQLPNSFDADIGAIQFGEVTLLRLPDREWTSWAANIVITRVERIPLPNTDLRTWPIVFNYNETYDPHGGGYFEFTGEFEINAFGGLKFNKHNVYSRSLAEWAIGVRRRTRSSVDGTWSYRRPRFRASSWSI